MGNQNSSQANSERLQSDDERLSESTIESLLEKIRPRDLRDKIRRLYTELEEKRELVNGLRKSVVDVLDHTSIQQEETESNCKIIQAALERSAREKEILRHQYERDIAKVRETGVREKEILRYQYERNIAKVRETGVREKEILRHQCERDMAEVRERLRQSQEEKRACQRQQEHLRTLLTAEINKARSSISNDDVTVCSRELGRGSWATVVEGKFRGMRVAVKKIHSLIQSPDNRELFEREIRIAALVRHPCILQFLGVVDYHNDNPLLVTELMSMSLSDAMACDSSLVRRNVLHVGLDVAHGLNYLHHFRPNAIVHRDVSSRNVLMWKQDKQWRGKLGDLGSADFVSPNMSTFPGNPVYSAPESNVPHQSIKMDVYSFGVLICEVYTREDPKPEDRQRQIHRILYRPVKELVKRCTQETTRDRPTMDDVIHDLEAIDQH